jgi:GNAT superfamily N-acetyltransferase
VSVFKREIKAKKWLTDLRERAAKMINYKEVNQLYFRQYDTIPMVVNVTKHLVLEKVNGGLGGVIFTEECVEPYVKDLGKYEQASHYEDHFKLTNWGFFMAFDGERPVGGVTIVSKTENVNMLDGRDDLCVLWDIRVDDAYKHRGIGQTLFDLAVSWARDRGFKEMKIECQTNNVPACKFYHKQGAVLGKFDTYAYYHEPDICDEVQLIWYLEL